MDMQMTYGAMSKRTVSVRDILIAKAIKNGCNPYCKSTAADAHKVTEEMRASVSGIPTAACSLTAKNGNRPPIREIKGMPRKENTGRHEVVTIENFELVKRKPKTISFGRLVSVSACALVLCAVVYGGSLVNEEARRYSELTQTLENVQSENQVLELELAAKNDLDVIENIAKNDLGMIKVSGAEQRYISLNNENSINTYDADEGKTTFGMSLLNAFGEKISSILEYLE